MITQRCGGRAEQCRGKRHLHGRIGVWARAPWLERIAARLQLALEVACKARRANQVVEAVVVRFEFVVRERPVLRRQVGVEDARAIALVVVAAQLEVGGVEAIVGAGPVIACAAQMGGRIGKLPAAHGQGNLVGAIAEREGLQRRVLVQRMATRVLEFVMDGRRLEVGRRPARLAAFQHHNA